MITIQVHPPVSESNAVRSCQFSVYKQQPSDHFDIEGARHYIKVSLYDVTNISAISVTGAIATITYDATIGDENKARWQAWYIKVIDAIKGYVADNFPHRGHEVLSRAPSN